MCQIRPGEAAVLLRANGDEAFYCDFSICLFVCLAFLRFVSPHHGLRGDHIKSLC